MKRYVLWLIIAMIANFSAMAQCSFAPNMDFETGGFSNWQITLGSNAPPIAWSATVVPPVINQAEIMSGTGTDGYGGFPVVCPTSILPGNNFSLKLGGTLAGQRATRAKYTVTVPATESYVVVNYAFALVIQDPGHDEVDQPFFKASAYDNSGNVLSCASYNYNAVSLPGFILSANPIGGGMTWYQNWRTGSLKIPLSASPATIEFVTADCSQGGHFAYAYVDVDCTPFLSTIRPCYPGTTSLPNAPQGYSTYNWYELPLWTFISSTTAGGAPSISAPSSPTDYALVMTAFPGFGCNETLYVHAEPRPGADPGHIADITMCQGDIVTPSHTGTPTPGGTWSIQNPLIASLSPGGTVTGLAGGTTLITYSVSNDCGPTYATATITVIPTPLAGHIDDMTMCEGSSVMPVHTGPYSPGGTWSIDNTAIADINADGSIRGVAGGTTTVTYSYTNACGTAFTTALVSVNPLPTFTGFAEVTGHHCEGTELTFQFYTAPNAIIYFETVPGGLAYGLALGSGLFSYSTTAASPNTSIHIISIEDPLSHCTIYPDAWLHICVDPVPDVRSVWGDKLEICVGETVTFSSLIMGLGSGTGTWSTDNPGVIDLGLAGYVGLGVGPGTATVYYGVTNCCASSSNSTVITVNPLPSVTDISYFGCLLPCPNMDLYFHITGTPGATVYWSWQDPATLIWHSGLTATIPASGIATVFATPGASGEGMVYVRIDDIISDKGCHGRNNAGGMIKIAWPQATIMNDPETKCVGQTMTLYFQGPKYGKAWFHLAPSGPDMYVDLDATGQGTYTTGPLAAGTYTYCITGATGCCTHMYAGNCFTFTVYEYPTVVVSATPNPVCEGDNVVFTTTVTPTATDYVWSFADPVRPGFIVGLPSVTLSSVTMADNGYNGVTVYNHRCGTSASVNLVVRALPVVTSITYVGCKIPCPGTPLVYKITGTPGATVTWEYNDPCCPGTITGSPVTLNSSGVGYATVLYGVHNEGMVVMTATSVTSHLAPYCKGVKLQSCKQKVAWPYADICSNGKAACGTKPVTLQICGSPNTTVSVTATPAVFPPILVPLDAMGNGSFTRTIGVTTTFQVAWVLGCCLHTVAGTPVTVVRLPYPTMTLTYNDPLCEGNDLVLTATCTGCTDPYYWEGPAYPTGMGILPDYSSTPTYTISGVTPAYNGLYAVTGAAVDRNARLRCEANSVVDVIVHPLPVVSMTCGGAVCPSAATSPVTLNFTGGPSLGSVSFTSSPSFPGGSGSAGLNISGDGSATVAVPTSSMPVHFALTSVTASAADGGCTNHHILAGCSITDSVVTPPTGCPVYYDDVTNSLVVVGWVPGVFVKIWALDASLNPVAGGTITLTAAVTPMSPLYSGALYLTVFQFGIGDCTWGFDCNVHMPYPAPRPGAAEEGDMAATADAASLVRIIPNPNTGTFTLMGDIAGMTGEKTMEMEIVDMLGRAIYKNTVPVTNGHIKAAVKMDDEIANGTYLLRITGNDQNRTIRFVVQK
ncbi:hypothetical protein GCM10023093_08960 [Nemorincola caseinilytica]|uniref:T9SS type A sorting domain-containing protein n=1 Tax=Nemorincola caseinilytica TaxID=2054315 RepID=A0ABP8N6Z4_9BACT